LASHTIIQEFEIEEFGGKEKGWSWRVNFVSKPQDEGKLAKRKDSS